MPAFATGVRCGGRAAFVLTCSPWMNPGDSAGVPVGVLLADTNVLSACTDDPGASRRSDVGRTWFSFGRQDQYASQACHTGGILQSRWAAYIPRAKSQGSTPRPVNLSVDVESDARDRKCLGGARVHSRSLSRVALVGALDASAIYASRLESALVRQLTQPAGRRPSSSV